MVMPNTAWPARRASAWLSAVEQALASNASTVAVLWFGAQRVDAAQMQVGALFAYISYLIQILMSVMMATMVATMIPRASVSAERIMEVLDTQTTVVPPQQPTPIGAHIDGLLRSLRHLAEQDRVALLWDSKSDTESLMIDRDKFDKILLNLVINAAHAIAELIAVMM